MLKTYNSNEIKNNNVIQEEYFKIFISNTFLNNNNIFTSIKGITPLGELIIDGSFSNLPSDLFVIGEEVIKVVSSIYNSTTKETQLTVERGYFGTPITTFLVGDLVHSVIDVSNDVIQYNYNSKMDISNNPFLITYGTSAVQISGEAYHWSKHSTRKKYNYTNYKTKIFIFEGYDKKCILTSTGFLKKLNFSKSTVADRKTVTFNCVDQLGTYWDKDIKNKKQIKDMTVDEALAQILEIPIEKIYFKHLDKSLYPKIEVFVLSEYTTYKELFEIFSSNGIRFFFTPKGHLHIFSEVIDNKNLTSNKYIDDIRHLTNISLNNDSLLVFNYYDVDFKKRFPLYEVDKGFNYKYSKQFNDINFLYKNEYNDYLIKEITLYDTDIPPKISLDEYGKPSVLMLKEMNSGLEFICNPIEIYDNRFTLVPISIYNDTGLLDFGKGKFLEDLGFLGNLNFTLYYVNGNLPTVFMLTESDLNGMSANTNNLEYPIVPVIKNSDSTVFRDLNKNLTLEMGSPNNLKDLTYTGSFVGIDNLKGTWVGGTHLLYNREWQQSQNGLDVFVNATRTTDRNLCQILPVYNVFDNTGFELKISDKVDDSTIRAKFFNTVQPEIQLDNVEKISFSSNEIIGDLAVIPKNNLKPHDVLFPIKLLDGYTTYEKEKFDEAVAGNIKFIVTSQSTYNGETLLFINNPIFKNVEYGIIRLENIVYLQNFFAKLNPIVEQTSELNYINYPSVEEYDGRKEFTLSYTLFNETYTKKLISYVNSAYSGTSIESSKYIIPINTLKTVELELYDMISMTDNTITDIQSNNLFMIIGKSISKSPNRKIEYTLLNLYTSEIDYIDLTVAEVQTFNPLEEPTYQHSGIEQEQVTVDEYETRIQILDNRYGKLIGQLIPPLDFVMKSVENSVSPAFEVLLSGNLKEQYASEYFPSELFKNKLILKIQNEYLYVSGFHYKDTNGDTKYKVQVIKRQLGNSKLTSNLSSQKIVAYKIAEGSTKQYGLETSSIYVGNGTDSGFLSFDPIEGLRIKAKSIIMSTGEPIATQTDVTNVNNDLTDLINDSYDSAISHSDSQFTLNNNAISLLNTKVTTQGDNISSLTAEVRVNADNLQLAITEVDNASVKKDGIISAINLSQEGVSIKGDRVHISGDTVFDSDVNIKGRITGEGGITAISDDGSKITSIFGGVISFLEVNSSGNFNVTRTFRKMATDIYNYNPSLIQWIDIRSYTGGVEWGDFKIIAGITSANVNNNTRHINCEVIRHPSDKNYFYVKVGSSYLEYQSSNLLGNDDVVGYFNFETRTGSQIYYREFSGLSVIDVVYNSAFYYSVSPRLVVTAAEILTQCWIRYKPIGTSTWSGWILSNQLELDPSLSGQLFDIGVRIETTNNIKYILVDDWSSYDKTLVHPSSYVNVKVYGKATSTGDLDGGQAFWYAYET